MTPSLFGTPRRRAALPALAALGLAALAPTMARAQTQDLFVSNVGNNTISRFAGTGPGTFSTTATTLADPNSTLSGPEGLVFDAHGDLFAGNAGGNITEFASTGAGTFAAGQIFATLNEPVALAVDAHGDLFAASAGNNKVTEFAATGVGTFGTGKIVASGGTLNLPQGLAFDARGDLFAANSGNFTITEFAFNAGAGTFAAGTTLSDPNSTLDQPVGLAFDAKGNLFVADYNGSVGQGSVTEFASTGVGTFAAGQVFASGGTLNLPAGLAFDARGDLFAANAGSSSVTEFASNSGAGTFAAGQTVDTGGALNDSTFLAFSPVPPAVPEASTTVSLGLLLALGLGGVGVAARRKRRA